MWPVGLCCLGRKWKLTYKIMNVLYSASILHHHNHYYHHHHQLRSWHTIRQIFSIIITFHWLVENCWSFTYMYLLSQGINCNDFDLRSSFQSQGNGTQTNIRFHCIIFHWNLNLDYFSHYVLCMIQCCVISSNVISSNLWSHCIQQIVCPSPTFSLVTSIWMILHIILSLDPVVCHDLDPRSQCKNDQIVDEMNNLQLPSTLIISRTFEDNDTMMYHGLKVWTDVIFIMSEKMYSRCSMY